MYCAVFIRCTTALTCCHSLLIVVTLSHSFLLFVTRCTTFCSSLSLVVIRFHSLSLDLPLVCLFINDRQSAGDFKQYKRYLKNFFNKMKSSNKLIYIVDDTSINLIDFEQTLMLKII